MRLFTGIAIGDDVVERIRPFVQSSQVPNLHITTKFIGEWPESQLDELKQTLRQVVCPPFDVTVSGFGSFPRALYAAVKAGPELELLARRSEDACASLSIQREDRPYRPHITLKRVKHGRVVLPPHQEFGSFSVSAFHLYLSRSGQYTKLETFPLT